MPHLHTLRLLTASAAFFASACGCLADAGGPAISNTGSSFSGSYLAGRSADIAHDFKAAVAFYRAAVAIDPHDPQLQQRLLILSLASGDVEPAFALAASIIPGDPSNPAARLALAAQNVRQGKLDDALADLDHAGNGDLAKLTSSLASAWIEFGQGKVDAALDRVAALRGPGWYPVFVDLHTALLNEAAGRNDAAAVAIRKAYGDDNSALRVVVAYARIMARIGHADEAIKAITTLGGDNPVHPELRYLLADIKAGKKPGPLIPDARTGVAETLYGLGSAIGVDEGPELPAAYLQLASYLAPSSSLITMALGDVYTAVSRCDQAVRLYARVPRSDHLRRNADLQTGLCLEDLDRNSEATPYFSRVLAANPDDIEAAVDLGNNYRVGKRFAEAAAIYTRAIKLSGVTVDVPSNEQLAEASKPPANAAPLPTPDTEAAAGDGQDSGDTGDDTAQDGSAAPAAAPQAGAAAPGGPVSPQWRLFYYRGVAYEQSNHWPQAEADLKRALALNPEQPSVLNYLGYSWVDRGQNLDLALQLIEKAVRLKPTDGYIVDSLGWALYKLGRLNDAVKTMETAVQLSGGDATINDHLGDVYWAIGRKREAVFQWTYARDSSPDKDLLPKIMDKLKHGLPAAPMSGSNDHTSVEKHETLWGGPEATHADAGGGTFLAPALAG